MPDDTPDPAQPSELGGIIPEELFARGMLFIWLQFLRDLVRLS